MRPLLNPDLVPGLAFAAYRYRFLGIYVVIGVLSLGCEFVVYRGLERLGMDYPYCAIVGVASGVLLAYWGNVRFTFKVPIAKRRRALSYFVVISFLSWGVQFLVRRQIRRWSYEEARLAISGCAFLLAYALHRRFSFADYKKVAVAVYANRVEDIKSIHSRIENFPDVIHVDVADATLGSRTDEVLTSRLEVVRAYWPHKPIHVHIMSRTPSKYLDEIFPHADRVYIHAEIDEEPGAVLKRIRDAGKQAGIVITADTPLDTARRYHGDIQSVLFLGIATPGVSGQPFHMSTLLRVNEFNTWPERARVDVCVDGGVTELVVGLLNVEIVVSGSFVLESADPRGQIMRLQTSSSYEQI
jgi:ribulose-phosphate 3-epimerase